MRTDGAGDSLRRTAVQGYGETGNGLLGEVMEQGQSEITEEKARGFGSVFEQQCAVVGRLHGAKYIHIDLHAGCGWNHEVNVIGSPLLFQEKARAERLDYLLVCCERDKNRCSELGQRLKADHAAVPFFGDNCEVCDIIPDLMREYGMEPSVAFGSVLIDPNGFVGQIPWTGIERLFKTCGRLDVIFNFPGTAYTRNRGHDEHVHIDELPRRLSKKHWFIRKPLMTHKFTLCVGRNTDKLKIPCGKGKPFFTWCSDEGERCRKRAMLTGDEYARLPGKGQLDLWPAT